MRNSFGRGLSFVAGCLFAVVFLTRCGPAVGSAIDGGITMLHDAGMIPDGGMAMLQDAGLLSDGGSMMEIPAADAVTQSGTRLKAKYYKTPDGAQALLGWYDTQLQTDCSFTKMSDGTTRCLPSAAFSGTFFSDASCTHAFASQTKCATTPSYVVSYGTASCASVSGVSSINALGRTVTPTALYVASGDDCFAATGSSLQSYLSSYVFWEFGQTVPASTFVEATVATD